MSCLSCLPPCFPHTMDYSLRHESKQSLPPLGFYQIFCHSDEKNINTGWPRHLCPNRSCDLLFFLLLHNTSDFSCCHNTTPERSNLREGGFLTQATEILRCSFHLTVAGYSPSLQGSKGIGNLKQLVTSHPVRNGEQWMMHTSGQLTLTILHDHESPGQRTVPQQLRWGSPHQFI